MIAHWWKCWRCGHSAELNLSHNANPPPKCSACTNAVAPSGQRYSLATLVCVDDVKYSGPVEQASMLPLFKMKCSSCDAVYGEGENKPIWGYCGACWGVYLERQAENRRKMGFA